MMWTDTWFLMLMILLIPVQTALLLLTRSENVAGQALLIEEMMNDKAKIPPEERMIKDDGVLWRYHAPVMALRIVPVLLIGKIAIPGAILMFLLQSHIHHRWERLYSHRWYGLNGAIHPIELTARLENDEIRPEPMMMQMIFSMVRGLMQMIGFFLLTCTIISVCQIGSVWATSEIIVIGRFVMAYLMEMRAQ